MQYLNIDTMNAMDGRSFRRQHPYPWANPQGLITKTGWRELIQSMPDISAFEPFFNVERKHGQQSFNRHILLFQPGMQIAQPWQEFIQELQSKAYYRFVSRLFGRGHIRLQFQWHYTPTGSSVSPHFDSRVKIGTHIFYFNDESSWDESWGGATTILDDNGQIKISNPSFDDFYKEYPAKAGDNTSLIFRRINNSWRSLKLSNKSKSWHGVRELKCPEDQFRKVFIVTFVDAAPHRLLYKKFKRLMLRSKKASDKKKQKVV